MVYHFRAVIMPDSFSTAYARGDAFTPPGKSGEEVGLDKAGTDAEIGVNNVGINLYRGAAGSYAKPDGPPRVMVLNDVITDYVTTQF
jgi:hypothetical protein